jgi:Fe-S oxidoreductase
VLVPGVTVREIRQGCCGIAGTFGMKAGGYDISMESGSALLGELASPEIDAGMSECSTCKMQMEHGSSKTTLHPLKILAHGYGLIELGKGATNAKAPAKVA